MTGSFGERLIEHVERAGSAVAIGVDAHLDRLPGPAPRTVAEAADAVARYFAEVLELARPHACAVKFQLAFFEALGVPGWQAYEVLLAKARALGLLTIADAKRGDIGSTSAAYARAHLGRESLPGVANPLCADAITLSPYLGGDGLAPFVETAAREGAGLFVLVKTSNPGSADFQDLATAAGEPVYERVARRLVEWGAPHRGGARYGPVGAVVGATHVGLARTLAPLLVDVPKLVPGYGEQGGRAEDLAGWFDADGHGALVPVSRSLAFAGHGTRDWQGAVARAAWDIARDVDRARGRT